MITNLTDYMYRHKAHTAVRSKRNRLKVVMTQSSAGSGSDSGSSSESWYIVKCLSEQCEIVSEESLISPEGKSADSEESSLAKWGPFETQNQAIAKRVGLIRAGKCKPS